MRRFGFGERRRSTSRASRRASSSLEDCGAPRSHGRLRPGRRQHPIQLVVGGQHDRQRRHVRRARGWSRAPSTPTARSTERRPSATREVVAPEVAAQMQRMMKRGRVPAAPASWPRVAGTRRSPARPAPASRPSPTAAYLNAAGRSVYYASFVGFLPGRGSAGHRARVDRRAAGRRRRPLRRHRRRARCSRTWCR